MAFPTPHEHDLNDLNIRAVESGDMPCIERLSGCGLLENHCTDENLDRAYVDRARRALDLDKGNGVARFWVADVCGAVVATIGSDPQEPEVAIVAWLRVDPVWRESRVVLLMIYTALKTCMDQGCVKVRLEAQIMAIASLAALLESGHLVDLHYGGVDRDANHVDVYPSLYAPWPPVESWQELSRMLGPDMSPDLLN